MIAVVALMTGALVISLVLQDAFEVMLLPRRVIRRWRLMRGYFRSTWAAWTAIARATSGGPRRERFLSIFGPLSMMLLFAVWASALICAFALVQWAVQHMAGYSPSLGEVTYLSGVTFFTLGYGEVIPRGGWARVLAVVEAGVGLGLIADRDRLPAGPVSTLFPKGDPCHSA